MMGRMTPDPAPIPFPDRDAIRAILRHREALRRPPEEMIALEGGGPADSGAATMPFYTYDDEVRGFVAALYDLGFVARFDWPDWQEKADALQHDAEALRSADLTDLVKLLTVHVRKERFCEGHLAVAIEEGWFRAILDRLAAIEAELDRSADAAKLIANREHLSAL